MSTTRRPGISRRSGKGFGGVFGSPEHLNTSNTPPKPLLDSYKENGGVFPKSCTQIPTGPKQPICHELIAAPIDIAPPAAFLSGRVLRNGRIKFLSTTREAQRKRKYRRTKKPRADRSPVLLPDTLIDIAFNHLMIERPEMRQWPDGDPRWDAALSERFVALFELGLKAWPGRK
jgi:hypothetical protein